MRRPRQREADLRAQLAANRSPASASASWPGATGWTLLLDGDGAVLDYAERRTRARDRGDSRRRLPRRPTCSRTTAAASRRARDRCRRHHPRRRGRGRLHRHRRRRRPATSTARSSVTKSACYYVLRVLTDPDIPPSAGAYRPVRGDALRRAASSTPPAGGGRGRQRRDVEPDRRRRACARSARRVEVPAAGQGTMNNLTLGDERLHLLRDDRRRPGRLPRRRRPLGRARGDEQHAQHARRGARAGVPVAGDAVRAAPRIGRRGRHRGGDGVVRELEALPPMEFSLLTERRRQVAPPGRGRRRRGRGGAATLLRRRPGRRAADGSPGEGPGRLGPRRPAADRDPRRRRPRAPTGAARIAEALWSGRRKALTDSTESGLEFRAQGVQLPRRGAFSRYVRPFAVSRGSRPAPAARASSPSGQRQASLCQSHSKNGP